jgi:hypothetical protein
MITVRFSPTEYCVKFDYNDAKEVLSKRAFNWYQVIFFTDTFGLIIKNDNEIPMAVREEFMEKGFMIFDEITTKENDNGKKYYIIRQSRFS